MRYGFSFERRAGPGHNSVFQDDDGDWYYMQGRVLMAMDQYESAHQAFREAVRLSPENNVYRSGALAAVVAQREAGTFHGRVKKAFKNILKK